MASELASTLDYFDVPEREKQEVLAAFNGQKLDVIAGSMPTTGRRIRLGSEEDFD